MKHTNRIVIVDALRGFALLLIVLIHYVEHFDFFLPPESNFLFSPETDGLVMKGAFFFISGKAYSIFALLFGFSFFIQLNRQEEKGVDFRGRFVWRLVVLFVIGFIHSLFYKGDILNIYATLGLSLVLLWKVNTKALWWIAVLLALQIPMLYQFVQSVSTPDFKMGSNFWDAYWGPSTEAYRDGNLWEVMKFNFWKGRATVWGWSYANGRFFQLVGLFVVGLILGRKRVFDNINENQKRLVWVIVISFVLTAIFFWAEFAVVGSTLAGASKNLLKSVVESYKNLAITASTISIMIWIYSKFPKGIVFRWFAAYGKMSLTNYVSQAFLGIILFYGFGFGLYRYLGSAWSVILGVAVFASQVAVSTYWAKRYYYGPLEWLWRALTFMDFGVKFKKQNGEEQQIFTKIAS